MTDNPAFPPAPPAPPTQPPFYQPMPIQPPRRGGTVSRIIAVLATVFLLLSVAANVVLFMFLALAAGGGAAGTPGEFVTHEVIKRDSGDRVAILPAAGTVDGEMVDRVSRYIHAIRADKRIKAVVVEVDSPGGSITASDEIHHMLAQLAKDYHVVVSMRGLAASGGYYISMPAKKIYAQPTTITGSIGVIWPAFEVADMLEKVGITPQMITSDQATHKNRASPFRKFNDEDVQYIKGLVNDAHGKFKTIVATGRAGKIANVDTIATGEVWPADKALALGLVDEIAYLDEVCDKTAADAGIANPEIIRMKDRPSLLGILGGTSNLATSNGKVSIEVDPKKALMDLTTPRLEYRWVP